MCILSDGFGRGAGVGAKSKRGTLENLWLPILSGNAIGKCISHFGIGLGAKASGHVAAPGFCRQQAAHPGASVLGRGDAFTYDSPTVSMEARSDMAASSRSRVLRRYIAARSSS